MKQTIHATEQFLDAFSSLRDRMERVLILHPQRFYREALRAALQTVLLTGSIFAASSIAEAAQVLGQTRVDLLVTEIVAPDGEVLDKIPEWTGAARVQRVFAVSAYGGPHIVGTLRRYAVRLYFNGADSPENFHQALQALLDGGSFWSSVPPSAALAGFDREAVWKTLTPSEKAVLATIGDGTDDKTAAARLHKQPGTIRRIRESLHRKLAVNHKGELVQKAIALGCVVITPDGVFRRPGYAALLADYRRPDSAAA